VVWGLLLIAAAEAAAAPVKAPAPKPDEIIVTGERVKRALKDTPSSVHVITERELAAMPLDRVEQVLAGVPNVLVGSGSQGPTIRGQDTTGVLSNLAAFLGGTRPRATLEVDGRAVGFQEFVFGNAPLWDVRQVEVFRSPLTVTHGRNSIAGGIVITTNDPTYNWEGAGRVIGGNFSTREGSAVVSGPIIADELAFRVAGEIRQSRTTVKLAPLMRGADPNDDKYSLLRFKLLGEPRAVPGLKLMASFTRSYSQAPQAVIVTAPFRDRVFPFGGYGIFGVHVSAGTIHAAQQFTDAQIEAIVSLGNTRTRRYAQAGLGEARARLRDLSGELFGSWKAAKDITLRGGVHSLDSRFRQHIDLSRFIGSIGDFRDRQRSLGAFAEAEIAVTPRLTLDGGGRYQHDRQRRVGGLVGAVDSPIDFDGRFTAWLPKLTASYALTPRLKAGVLVQRAYNPGGATIDVATGELDTFRAERLWDYEAFVKGDLPGGKVSVEANLFYNDIRDAQRGVLIPFTLPDGEKTFDERFNNIPKASTRGAEIELNWHPSAAFRLNAGLGLLRTRLNGTHNSDGAIIGSEFAGAPRVTASAAVDWSPVKPLRLSAQLRYHGRYFSDDFDSPELRIGRGTIVDARAAYQFRNFTLFAYARNAFDSFHLRFLGDPEVGEAEDPRVAGVGIEARF
jgi:outer membrane receptor protein involved in Fe transport